MLLIAALAASLSAPGWLFALTMSPTYVITELARQGNPTPLGGTFRLFGTGTINNSGAVVFDADLTGDFQSDAVFLYDGIQLRAIVAVGDPPPGGGALSYLARPAVSNSGAVVFSSGPSTFGCFNSRILLWRDGVLSDVVRVGQPTPVGGTFSCFPLLSSGSGSINSRDEVVFRGFVSGGSTPRGLFVRASDGLRTIATVGSPAPVGGTFSDFGNAAPAINDAGAVLFWASVSGGTSGKGLFLYEGSNVTTVAAAGQATPLGGVYNDFPAINSSIGNGPALNNTPEVSFYATINGGTAAGGIFDWKAGAVSVVSVENQGPSLNNLGWLVFKRRSGFTNEAIIVEHSGIFEETGALVLFGENGGVGVVPTINDRIEIAAITRGRVLLIRRDACGDEVVDPNEECDDANRVDGDGCDSNCTPTGCGNNIVTAGEECDDGNLLDCDGCDRACRARECTPCDNGWSIKWFRCDFGSENSFVLQRDGTPVCGSGNCPGAPGTCWSAPITQRSFESSGNVSWTIGPSGELSVGQDRDVQVYGETFLGVSSPTSLVVPLTADVGRVWLNDIDVTESGPSGSDTLNLEAGWNHLEWTSYNQNQGTAFAMEFPFAGHVDQMRCTGPVCGDGVRGLGEECDDGNTLDGDCCSSNCQFEPIESPCTSDGLFCTGIEACDGAGTCQSSGNPCPGTECNRCQEDTDICRDPVGTLCAGDGNVCTNDQCNGAGACVHPNNTVPCDDGNPCTVADRCASGVCEGEPACGDGAVQPSCGEECDDGNLVSGDGCSSTCQLEPLCPVTLRVGDAVNADPEFCVDVELSNTGTAVRGVQGSLIDGPDEFELMEVACVGRAAAFTCSANQTADNRIAFVVLDLQGGCIDAGTGPILRVCLRDNSPTCPVPSLVELQAADVQAADCASQPVPVCTEAGHVTCALGDSDGNGVLDVFDVLRMIDIVLGRVTPTSTEAARSDTNCNGTVDIFDILRVIDAILGRIPQPLTCPAQGAAALSPAATGPAPRVVLGALGRALRLTYRGSAVRAVELTLVPEGGPVDVVGARATRRTRGFLVAVHQTGPTAPVKVVVLSLAGEAIPPGDGAIARLELTGGSPRGRLRLTDVRVAE